MSHVNQSVQTVSRQKEGRKSNKAFMLLSALGIIFVVDVHLGQPLAILTNIFPYDSFFMPMFAFISGYFFKELHCQTWKDVLCYSLAKMRKLFIPYLGWVVFYNCLSAVLFHMGIWNIQGLSLRDLVYGVVTTGVTSAFNSPAWFAPLLFGVSVTFCVVRRMFHKIWNDHVFLAIFLGIGIAVAEVAGNGFDVPLLYMVLKVPFFLQFYYIGLYFRKYWEFWFDRCHIILICLVAVAINRILISHYGNAVEFPLCSAMAGFHSGNPLMPLITSVTGTAFWLKISKALVPMLGHNRLVNYISDNTFFIMTHHIGVKHLFVAVCLLGSHMGVTLFSGIDVQQFLSDGLYLYNAHSWCAPACFVFSMAVLLIGCKLFDTLINLIPSILTKKQP